MAVGAVFIVYWAVKHLSDKPCGSQINYGTAEFTQNNYYVNGASGDNDQEMFERDYTVVEKHWRNIDVQPTLEYLQIMQQTSAS